jgi:hypothetical protein
MLTGNTLIKSLILITFFINTIKSTVYRVDINNSNTNRLDLGFGVF